MRVEAGEIEFARDEKEDGAHRSEARVTAGPALGSLKQTVDGLDEAVGLAGMVSRAAGRCRRKPCA